MRKCLNSAQQDVTADVQTYLMGTVSPVIRHLYLIGNPEDPNAIFMCDHESPLVFEPWGTFLTAVVSKDTIATKVGLEVQKTTVTWTPSNLTTGNTIPTANPLQKARLHVYDNYPVRIWKCFLNSTNGILGACEWFGGRIGSCVVGRNQIEFSVSSFLDVVSQKVPANVIESTSTLAGYTAASLVAGEVSQPTFQVFTGSTTTVILADCISPSPNKIYSGDQFVAGYMVFLAGPGATLAGVWSAIGGNGAYKDGNGNNHSNFEIYTQLPWAPTPVVDQFYVSPAAPINLGDSADYAGFPFCPNPTQAA